MTEPLLKVRNLDVSVRDKKGHEFKIVDDISFDVQPGEVIALIGESGSGKTTISLGCMGYTRPGCHITGGSVELGGTRVLEQSLAASAGPARQGHHLCRAIRRRLVQRGDDD